MKIVVDYSKQTEAIGIIEITAAKLVTDYQIEITFSDGKVNHINFAPFLKKSLHPEIKRYLDKTNFANFNLIDGNLNWNDYDLIFPIADLYSGEI